MSSVLVDLQGDMDLRGSNFQRFHMQEGEVVLKTCCTAARPVVKFTIFMGKTQFKYLGIYLLHPDQR